MVIRAFGGVFLVICSVRAGTLSVSPAVNQVAVGQVFSLNVVINSVADLYAYQFDLAFNPALLNASAITEGAFLGSGGPTFFLAGAIDNVNGLISSTADSLEGPLSGVTGSGVLTSVTFTALAPGSTSVSIFNTFLIDSQSNFIFADTGDGTVDVVTPEPAAGEMVFLAFAVLAVLKPLRRAV